MKDIAKNKWTPSGAGFNEDLTLYMIHNGGNYPDLSESVTLSERDKDINSAEYSEVYVEFVNRTHDYILNLLEKDDTRILFDANTIPSSVRIVSRDGCIFQMYFNLKINSVGMIKPDFIRYLFDTKRFGEDKNRAIGIKLLCSNDSEFFRTIYSDYEITKESIHQIPSTPNINFLVKTDSGLMLRGKDIEDNVDSNITELYNNDFESVHNRVLTKLSEEDTGLYLFHGEVGSGKTSYIRHLISHLSSADGKYRRVIYLPPNLIDIVSDFSFIDLLSDNTNSVVVIEDAENILKTRDGGSNSAVANILNSTDGLLGDVLKCQFICTFNAPVEDIDPALFRGGRLTQEYRFDKLEVDRAKNVWVNRLGHPEECFPNEPMSLAELFNYDEPIRSKEKEKIKLGFV